MLQLKRRRCSNNPAGVDKLFHGYGSRQKNAGASSILKEHMTGSKILLFLCSAASVEYLANILPGLLDCKELKILAMHGKRKISVRRF
uniref:Uncharacterized protein n=1 Tax=Ditylenchus dipsaci TaxID=166011 RepID=A0A915ENH0_9BILA